MKKKYIEYFLQLEIPLIILMFIGAIMNNFWIMLVAMIFISIIQFIQVNKNN
jgi:hypothetical protein